MRALLIVSVMILAGVVAYFLRRPNKSLTAQRREGRERLYRKAGHTPPV